jgi:hypothetical protein
MKKYKYKKNEQKFSDISIFGSLTNYLINIAQNKNISLIYGVPNNTSYQGYVKNLNFKKLDQLNVFSYSLPCFKSKNDKLDFKKTSNLILNLYRNFIYKILFRKFKITYNDELNINEINKFSEKRNKIFYLNRNKEYFYNKYKSYPESMFKFCKVYRNSELVGIYVLKEDLNNRKIFIVDCLVEKKNKFLIKLVALRSAIDKNFSVNFWDKRSIINFFEKIIFNIFERNKINIIYYDKNNFDQNLFFEEFYIGFSDNF